MSLDLRHTLQKLQTYNNSSIPIVSVYLPLTDDKNTLKQQFNELVHASIDTYTQEQYKQNLQYISSFLEQYKSHNGHKSLAIFTGDNQLWEVVPTIFQVKPYLAIDHSPYLQPLLEGLSDYRRYLVVLTDRTKALFFTLYQGFIEDQGVFEDDSVPQNVHADAAEALYANREDKIDRHIQDHIHRHFQTIATKVQDFSKGKPISGVIVGGHKNLIHKFEKHLPKNLQDKIVGEFVSELNVNLNELVDKSKEIVKKVNDELNHQHTPHVAIT